MFDSPNVIDVSLYNKSALTSYFIKCVQKKKTENQSELKWGFDETLSGYVASFGGISGEGSTKPKAKMQAALSYFSQHAIDITKFLKPPSLTNACQTPIQIINMVCDKFKASIEYNAWTGTGEWTAKMTWQGDADGDKGEDLVATYKCITNDKRYLKNKIALLLLKKIVVTSKNDEKRDYVLESLKKVEKSCSYVHLTKYDGEEGYELEFKGPSNPSEVAMTYPAVMNKKEDIAKEVCSFLNADEAAKVLIGIRDDKTIVGINITNIDKLLLALQNHLLTIIKPSPVNFLRFEVHKVLFTIESDDRSDSTYVVKIRIFKQDDQLQRRTIRGKSYLRVNNQKLELDPSLTDEFDQKLVLKRT